MLPRVLEPEVMDTAEEAADYDAMDHAEVNRRFVDDLLAAMGDGGWSSPRRVFDAGTGTALIPIELLSRGVAATVVAADAAVEMLRLGTERVAAAGLSDRITLVEGDCKRLPEPTGSYEVVLSNSLIHHVPEPCAAFAELWRIVKPGGLLFVRDLYRPASTEEVERLVARYAAEASAAQRQLFRQSFHAALAVPEVDALLRELGIPGRATMTSDRHWTVSITKP